MSKRLGELPEPLNVQERLLYAIAVRQNIMIEQLNSVVDYIANQDKLATTNHVVEEKIATKATKTVSAKPVAKPVESVEAEVKPTPVKRATRTASKKK